MRIDFLAAQPHYLDHMAPVWYILPNRYKGIFWIPETMLDYVDGTLFHDPLLKVYNDDTPKLFRGTNPVLVASYGDMLHVHNANSSLPILMMEHGTGHTFGKAAYPNGPGKRDHVTMFLSPNQYTVDKIHSVRQAPCHVIGTPKLDKVIQEINPHRLAKQTPADSPLIAIGFHWGTKRNRPPESGSAFEHYKDIIPELSRQYKLLAYGHPLAKAVYKPFYEDLGIEYTSDLFDVMKRADICINDLSSALYEFLVTGKPVIVLNAPWFRRDIQHGIRFWDYSDIGINVEKPEELMPTIENTLSNYIHVHLQQRSLATHDLFPFLGHSAERASEVIQEYLKEQNVT